MASVNLLHAFLAGRNSESVPAAAAEIAPRHVDGADDHGAELEQLSRTGGRGPFRPAMSRTSNGSVGAIEEAATKDGVRGQRDDCSLLAILAARDVWR